MIKEALDSYAKGLKSKFNLDERSATVGASEIGACARKTYWSKHPAHGREDEDFKQRWGALLRGTVMEDKFWEPALKKKYGRKLFMSGKKQQSIKDKYLSATPDGLLTGLPRDFLAHLDVPDIESDCILLECKSIDPRVNLREAKAENEYQVQVQLGLVRELTEHKPVYALISYTDASFWDEVSEYPIKFNLESFRAAHARAKKILTANRAEDFPPEGWIAGGSECEYCPFTKACGVVRRSFSEKDARLDEKFMKQITDLAVKYRTIKDQLKSSDAHVRTLQEEMKNLLRSKGIRRVDGVVTWSPVKGRESVDMRRLKEDAAKVGFDLDAYSTVGDPTDSLLVTIK